MISIMWVPHRVRQSRQIKAVKTSVIAVWNKIFSIYTKKKKMLVNTASGRHKESNIKIALNLRGFLWSLPGRILTHCHHCQIKIQEDSSSSSGDSEPEEEESFRQSKSPTKV